ncbi:DUF3626 domain-containing protein [Mycolicibacterium smegmatis]|uniref:DUF3626 domain-containing protein n=1 Tax=Mycolicibacterium smegmatis TaxID=1772 RepID=UPI001303D429|nr:DUF3626 domain-containing protein [Mycolicibacterium smegmatis]
MSIVIPPPLQWVSYLAGSKWPQGDEDKMFALADIWHAEAEDMRALVPDLMRVRAELIDTLTGETADTAKQNFALLFDGDASVDKLSDAMTALGNLAYDTAGQIEANKIEILATLALAAADILFAIACAPFTFGASLSWIPPIEVFSITAVRLLFEQLLRRIIAEVASALARTSVQRLTTAAGKEAVHEILEESIINLGIQAYQVKTGHKHGFDVNSFGQSALGGAVGGAAGGAAHKGLGKLLGDSNNLTGKALRNGLKGFGSGLGGDVAATLATGGDIDAGTLFAGNATGGVGGALHGDGHGGHHLMNLVTGPLGLGPTSEKVDPPGGDHEAPPPYSESQDPTQQPSATSPQSAVSHLKGQQGPETHPRGDVGGPTAPAPPPPYDSVGHTPPDGNASPAGNSVTPRTASNASGQPDLPTGPAVETSAPPTASTGGGAAPNSTASNSSAPNSTAPNSSSPSSPGGSAPTGKEAQPHSGGSLSRATDSTPVPATHRATAPVATSTSSGATAHRPVADGTQEGVASPRRAAVPAPPPLPLTAKPAVTGVQSGGAPPTLGEPQHRPNVEVSGDESWRHDPARTAEWFEPANPTPGADIASRRDDTFVQTVDTEVADVLSTSTPASIATHTGLVRYDLRRIEVAPGKFVQEYTVKLNVSPADPSVGRDAVADVQRKVSAGVDRILNQGNRLPSGDEFRVNVEFTDTGAHAAVKVGDSDENSQTTWRPDISEDVLAHEILHYLGVPDENRDPRIALRRHPQNSGVHEGDGGVMTSDVLGGDPSLRPRHLWIVERTANSQVSVPISLVTSADNARTPRQRSDFDAVDQPAETRRAAGFEGELRGGYTVEVPAGNHAASYETVAENDQLSLTLDVHMNRPVLEVVTKPAAAVPGDEGRPTSAAVIDEVRNLTNRLRAARREASLARILEDRFRLDPDADDLKAVRKDPAGDVGMYVHHSVGIPLAGLTQFMEHVHSTTRTDPGAAGAARSHLSDALTVARALGEDLGWGADASAAGRAAAEGFAALVYTQFAAMAQRVHSGTDWAKNYSAMNSRVSMAAVAEGLEPAVRQHLDRHGPVIAERFAASFRDHLSENTHDRNLLDTGIPDSTSEPRPTIRDYLRSAFSSDATRSVVNQTDALKIRTTLPGLDTNDGRIDPPLVVVELRHLHRSNVPIEEVAQTHGVLIEWSRQAFELAHQLRGTSAYAGVSPSDTGRPALVQPPDQHPMTSIATSVFDPESKKLNDLQRAELDGLARDVVDRARRQLQTRPGGLHIRAEGGGNGGRFSRGADAVGKERARVTLDYLRTRIQQHLETRAMGPDAVTVSSDPSSRGTALDDQLDGPDEKVRRTVKVTVEEQVPAPTLPGVVSGLPDGTDLKDSAVGSEVPSDIATVRESLPVTGQTHTDVQGWIGDVNNDGDPSVAPAGDRLTNCGPTTWTVFDRLSGIPGFGRAHPAQLRAETVGAATGLPLRASDPDAIAEQLRNAGAGAHTIVVTQFDNGVAHSFNALFDGDGVWAIDGQHGTVTAWPPALGRPDNPVTAWFVGTPAPRPVTDAAPRASVIDTQVSISDSPVAQARALFSDESPMLPMSAAALERFVDGVAPELPLNPTRQDCVPLTNWLLRRLYPRGLTNLTTVDDSRLGRGGVTGAKAAVIDGPGWARVGDRDELVGLITDRPGATAVLMVSRPGGAVGHVLAAHATTDGVRWLDLQRPAHERVSKQTHPDRLPPEVVSAPTVWALVIDPDGGVQTPGAWSMVRPSVEALLDADTTRRFGSPGDDGGRSRAGLRDYMTRRRFSRTQRRMTQEEHNEVMGRLAAGDAVSLRREVERAENRRSARGFEEERSAWAPQARRRLEDVLGIAPEWSQQHLDRMVDHLMGSRVTHNFHFSHWVGHHGEFVESGERLVSGWESNTWSVSYANSRDASEREIGLYDRDRDLDLDLDPARAAAVRDRISRYMSRRSPLFRPAGRPHYGVLDYANARAGGARQYGHSFMVFRDHVKSRSTFTPGDSLDPNVAAQSATLVNMEKLLVYCSDNHLRRIHAWATQGGEPGRVPPHYGSNYIETQIHSDIEFARDIEALYIAESDLQLLDEQSAARAWAVLEGIAAQCGIRLARI